jgi:hypothetical protein
MADREWLLASNRLTLFAVPRQNIAEVISGIDIVELPFGSEHISGIFLHKGKVMPLLKDEEAGFAGNEGDLLLLENRGEAVAVPVKRILGFSTCPGDEQLEHPVSGPFLSQINYGGQKVPVLEVETLYKQLGFI